MVIPIFKNFRGILVVCILLAAWISYALIYKGSKTKDEYEGMSGTITYIGDTYGEMPYRDKGSFKYIVINTYQYPLELFIGETAFKPKLAILDSLHVSDFITVYGYQTNATASDQVNRTVKFIDKGNMAVFDEGNHSAQIAYYLLIIPVGLIIICFIIYKKGKMPF